MKYQTLNDLIDPDVPAPSVEPVFDETDQPGANEDAYVIGSEGDTVQVPYVQPAAEGVPSKPKPWAKPAAHILCGLCVVLTVWNINHLLKGPDPLPAPSPFQVKQALYLGVMKVDAYRRAHGVTPGSLKDIDLPEPAYGYRRVDSDHYIISFQSDSPRVEYDSQQPKDSFFGPPRTILAMGESQ